MSIVPRPAHTPTLPCSRCGYDLVGLDVNSPCPECAIANAGARARSALAAAGPTRLRILVASLRLLGWIQICIVVQAIIWLALYGYLAGSPTGAPRPMSGLMNGLLMLAAMLFSAGIMLTYVVASVVFARREQRRHNVSKQWLAWCIYVAAGLAVLGLLAQGSQGTLNLMGPGLVPNMFTWPVYLGHVLMVVCLQLLPAFVAIAAAGCAREMGRKRLSQWIIGVLAVKGMAAVLDVAAVTIGVLLWSGNISDPRLYALAAHAAWVEWLYPRFDDLCTLVLGILSLALARHIRRVAVPASDRLLRTAGAHT